MKQTETLQPGRAKMPCTQLQAGQGCAMSLGQRLHFFYPLLNGNQFAKVGPLVRWAPRMKASSVGVGWSVWDLDEVLAKLLGFAAQLNESWRVWR